MAVRLKLSDGSEMLVQATLDELTRALRAATERGDVLKIEQPDGRTIAVTPQAVETIVEEPKASCPLDGVPGRPQQPKPPIRKALS